jgi:hypothetical protein
VSITASQAKVIGAELDAAVEQVLTKHGLVKGKRMARYGDMFKYSIEATELALNADGVNTRSKEALDFIAYSRSLGFKDGAAAIGQKFDIFGPYGVAEQYILLGYRPRARKHPILVQKVSDGKNYIMPLAVLRKVTGYDIETDPVKWHESTTA